jgi:putative SOS response-associated peptidase YedK
MCYRISVPGGEYLEKHFNARISVNFERKYHVSAFSEDKLPVITDDEPKQIQLFNWGLIPFWIKNKNQADEIRKKTANARAESIFDKPAYRNAARTRHCLVLADGFFEWREVLGRKYPYYIKTRDGNPFAMAGLWEIWNNPKTNETVFSFSIITTEANNLMRIIHNKKKRMPVILLEECAQLWIDKNLSEEEAKELLAPLEDRKLEAYSISKFITSRNKNIDVPDVIQPFEYPGIESHFR